MSICPNPWSSDPEPKSRKRVHGHRALVARRAVDGFAVGSPSRGPAGPFTFQGADLVQDAQATQAVVQNPVAVALKGCEANGHARDRFVYTSLHVVDEVMVLQLRQPRPLHLNRPAPGSRPEWSRRAATDRKAPRKYLRRKHFAPRTPDLRTAATRRGPRRPDRTAGADVAAT